MYILVAKKVHKINIHNTQQTHLYKYINGRVIIIFVSLKHSKKKLGLRKKRFINIFIYLDLNKKTLQE